MTASIGERELAFMLYEFLDIATLPQRPRYAGQSREEYDAILESSRRLAEAVFASHNVAGDRNPPIMQEGRAAVIPETGRAWQAFADAGFLNAHWDSEENGLQLPEVMLRAALASFFSANAASAAYPFLTIGAANLLRAFGGEREKRLYLPAMGDGRSSGTMALTEPDQGSALGDIKTMAVPHSDGSYRIQGQKIFISGGEQDFTSNIVHMVLARIQGAPAGTKGISLFLVPKRLVNADGSLGERNDVALTGLLHKMGWRNTTSTLLSFGEQGGAVGYLVGQPRHAWKRTGETLGAAGYFAVAFDARGHGDSSWASDGAYGQDIMVRDLQCVVAALGNRRPVLIGASMGGGTSLVAAGERQVDASALVLVDIAPRIEPERIDKIQAFMSFKPEGFDSLDEVADAIAAYQPHRQRPANLQGLAKNVRLAPNGKYRWHWDPMMRDPKRDLARRQLRLEACARALTIPTLLVRGGLSDVLSESGVREFQQLVPAREYVSVGTAGHMVAGDRNDSFGTAAVEFLTRVVPVGLGLPDIQRQEILAKMESDDLNDMP